MRIRNAMIEHRDLMSGIVEMDETYVGGKPRKGGEPSHRGRGIKKTPAVGMFRSKTVIIENKELFAGSSSMNYEV